MTFAKMEELRVLRIENEKLTAEVARLRKALEQVAESDRNCQMIPTCKVDGLQRWVTASTFAHAALEATDEPR